MCFNTDLDPNADYICYIFSISVFSKMKYFLNQQLQRVVPSRQKEGCDLVWIWIAVLIQELTEFFFFFFRTNQPSLCSFTWHLSCLRSWVGKLPEWILMEHLWIHCMCERGFILSLCLYHSCRLTAQIPPLLLTTPLILCPKYCWNLCENACKGSWCASIDKNVLGPIPASKWDFRSVQRIDNIWSTIDRTVHFSYMT